MEFGLLLIALLERIPATFWGVVIGSFFSILGVALTNRASENRLRKQFAHETAQKAKEREVSLKTEIYLHAIGALALGVKTIGELSNVYQADDKLLGPLLEKGHEASKVLVVASPSTAAAFARAHIAIRIAFLELYPSRLALVVQKNEIDGKDALLAKLSIDKERSVELMRQENLKGSVDMDAFATINRMFEGDSRLSDELRNDRAVAFRKLFAAQIAFGGECIAASNPLGLLVAAALSAVRDELELPIDAAVLREMVQDEEAVRVAHNRANARFSEMVGATEVPGPPKGPNSAPK